MAYVKQTWVNLPDKTTPISADRLNHIEDGIEAIDQDLENIDEHLTDYVKNTDYATASTGGVVKVYNSWGVEVSSGYLIGNVFNYSQYSSANEGVIICKGTLENVLNAKIGDIGEVLDEIQREEI